MNTRTETALRNAERSGDVTAQANAMRRAGLSFVDHYSTLLAEYKKAKRASKRLQNKISNFVFRRRLAAGECPRCENRGYITVHVHSGNAWIDDGRRDCPTCPRVPKPARVPFSAETTAKAKANKPSWGDRSTTPHLCAKAEARRIYSEIEKQVDAKTRGAGSYLGAFSDAARVGKGSLVALENTRARAKFKDDNSRVPVGTEGEVFWIRDDRFGVKTSDHRVFFTTFGNLSKISLNGWDRFLGIDPESEAKAAKEKTLQETSTLSVGDKILVDGIRLRVFWTGACKKTGRQRYGASRTRKSDASWGFSNEATKA